MLSHLSIAIFCVAIYDVYLDMNQKKLDMQIPNIKNIPHMDSSQIYNVITT